MADNNENVISTLRHLADLVEGDGNIAGSGGYAQRGARFVPEARAT